jgi:flagellar L-ring protein FlgH
MRTLPILLAATMLSLPAAAESLYREETFRPLTADHRAYRVGDALTVLVFENSSASSSADTNTEKQGGIGLSVETVGLGTKPSVGAKANLNDNFEGRGSIQRSGRLLAQLTVSVKAVAANGDLIVAGAQQIELNDEKQNIVLEGRVRPVDVSEANTVLSTRLADAKISYVGDGVLGEKQRPGILTRILSWLRIL